MKLKLAIIFLLLNFACSITLWAQEDKLPSPKLESEARDIFKNIRCLVCNSQSIEESNAEFAKDLRHIIREQLRHGLKREQIENSLIIKYGEQIVFATPANRSTFLLWLTPFVVIAASLCAAYFSCAHSNKNIAS